MKSDRFLRALGELDDELIAEYEKTKNQKRRTAILRYTALAAALCLVITATVTAVPFLKHSTATPNTEATGQSITASEYTPTAPPKAEGEFNIISVAAAKTDGTYISTDTDFIVTAENGSTDLVREHLFISGGPEYTVSEGEEENTYNVTLKKSLESNKVVSLSFVNDGVADYRWAFQTESKLQVTGNYPADGAMGVAKESVIELEFSHAIASDVSGFVTISPALEGSWERIGKIHRFTPAAPLAADTDYTVTVAAGITSGETTLESKHTFTFSTSEKGTHQCYPDPITLDGVNTYRTGESIVIRYEDHSNEPSAVGRVALHNFSNAENMIDYAGGKDTEEPTLIGDEAFSVETFDTDHFYSVNLTLDRTLSAGYYLARIYGEDGSQLFEWIIQVHPLTVYAAVTERDVLVWVANANGLAEGVSVRYLDSSATTGENGIALFEDVTDGSEETGWLYIGEKEAPLTVALKNYTHETYPSGYIYTDRPRYKTDDEIQVWGCIPMDLFYDEPDGTFTVSLEDEQKVTVTPDKNGTFTASLKIKDHTPDEWAQLKLCYNTKVIATRIVDIEDYELQNYTFELLYDRNYIYAGESFELGVKVFHISGITVAGKKVRVQYDGSYYNATTGEDGVARFSLPSSDPTASFDDRGSSSAITVCYASVYNGDIEESAATNAVQSLTFYMLNNDYLPRISRNDALLTVYHHAINTAGITTVTRNSSGTDDYNIIGAPADVSGDVTANVICTTLPIERYEYDPYTKTNKPVYGKDVQTAVSTVSIPFTTVDGCATVDLSMIEVPKNTETQRYHISYTVSMPTGNKHQYFSGTYHPNGNLYTAFFSYSNNFIYQGFGLNNYSYDLYNYCFTVNGTTPSTFEKTYVYKEGEHIDLRLKYLSGEFSPAGGTVLRLIYGNDIKDASLFSDSDELGFICDEKVFPHAKVTGAYYLNGVFYRMPYNYLQVDTAERNVSIDITTDKSSYAPGDEVTLTVTTTDKNGNSLPCAINVGVVNEAAFAYKQENNDILSAMLRARDYAIYPSYAYTSYRDYAMHFEPGGWGDGGGDEVRSDFGDTAAFSSLTTDSSGKATVTFTLPDSITEYRITVHAASDDMYYGVKTGAINTTMDFFLQFTEPKAVKDTDDLVLNANTVSSVSGTANFEFTVKETGATLSASAPTGANAAANFGKLPTGRYTARISASCGNYTDAVEFPFEIVRGAVSVTVSEDVNIRSPLTLTPASYPVYLEVYTESTRKYLEYFTFLQNNMSPRLDTLLPGIAGTRLKNSLLNKNDPTPRIRIDSAYTEGDVISLLPTSEDDYILTALHTYYTKSSAQDMYWPVQNKLGKDLTATELIERLMYGVTQENAVLTDLQSVESYVTDDAYQQTVLSISYAMLGDYAGAKRLYDAVSADSENEGYDALRAIAATFVDKKNAGAMIDALIASDPAAPYLSYAVYAYLASCSDLIKEEQTLTVSYGEHSESVSVSGLEIKTLTITGDGPLTVNFDTESERVCASVTYESTDPPAADGELLAYIEGDLKKGNTVELVLDLSELPCEYGSIDIVLPACVRYCHTGGSGVSAKNERLSAYKSSLDPTVMRIPLIVVNEGEYLFESVTLSNSGKCYRSPEFIIKATK